MNFTISKKNMIIYGVLFAIAIVLGIIVGCCGRDAGAGLYVTLAISMFGLLPFAKRFVLWVGRKVVDFATTLDLIFVMTILFAGLYSNSYYYVHVSYWLFVLGAFLYMVLAILMRYVLYILIDIKDSLHKLAYGENSENLASKAPVSVPNDMKQCPKCGQMIRQTAKKCRYCGEWLNEENKGEE